MMFPSSVACSDFCHLLITFASSLEPNYDRHNDGSDLDPNRLTLIVHLKDFLLKIVNFEKKVSR